MSFIPRTFGGLAAGLIDGKPGALSNAGNVVGGALLGKPAQRMIDKTGVNGSTAQAAARGDVGNNGGAGLTPLSGRARYGRGSSSLSV